MLVERDLLLVKYPPVLRQNCLSFIITTLRGWKENGDMSVWPLEAKLQRDRVQPRAGEPALGKKSPIVAARLPIKSHHRHCDRILQAGDNAVSAIDDQAV